MLRLSKKADYALIAMKHLARTAGAPSTSAREIAEQYDIPIELLAKVLQRLVRTGLLASTQGTRGGYALSRLLPGAGLDRCNAVGFAQSPPEDWLNGIWSGGASRTGEGFVFEYVNPTTVAVAWFTHRPASAGVR